MNVTELSLPSGITGSEKTFLPRIHTLFGQYLPHDLSSWRPTRFVDKNDDEILRFDYEQESEGKEIASQLTLNPVSGKIERKNSQIITIRDGDGPFRIMSIDTASIIVSKDSGWFLPKKPFIRSIFFESKVLQIPWGRVNKFIPNKSNHLTEIAVTLYPQTAHHDSSMTFTFASEDGKHLIFQRFGPHITLNPGSDTPTELTITDNLEKFWLQVPENTQTAVFKNSTIPSFLEGWNLDLLLPFEDITKSVNKDVTTTIASRGNHLV